MVYHHLAVTCSRCRSSHHEEGLELLLAGGSTGSKTSDWSAFMQSTSKFLFEITFPWALCGYMKWLSCIHNHQSIFIYSDHLILISWLWKRSISRRGGGLTPTIHILWFETLHVRMKRAVYTYPYTESNDSHGLNAEILFIVYNNISERAAENRHIHRKLQTTKPISKSVRSTGIGKLLINCWGYILWERI